MSLIDIWIILQIAAYVMSGDWQMYDLLFEYLHKILAAVLAIRLDGIRLLASQLDYGFVTMICYISTSLPFLNILETEAKKRVRQEPS